MSDVQEGSNKQLNQFKYRSNIVKREQVGGFKLMFKIAMAHERVFLGQCGCDYRAYGKPMFI